MSQRLFIFIFIFMAITILRENVKRDVATKIFTCTGQIDMELTLGERKQVEVEAVNAIK